MRVKSRKPGRRLVDGQRGLFDVRVFARATRIPSVTLRRWFDRGWLRGSVAPRAVGVTRILSLAKSLRSLPIRQRLRVLAALSEYESRKAEAAAKPRPAPKWPRPDADQLSRWAWEKNGHSIDDDE